LYLLVILIYLLPETKNHIFALPGVRLDC